MNRRITLALLALPLLGIASGATITGGIYGTPTPPAGGATPTFESNWDTEACTGPAITCLDDDGTWTQFANNDDSLNVRLGGSGGVPDAVSGSYVFEAKTGIVGSLVWGYVGATGVLDDTKQNQYYRWYRNYNCDYDMDTTGSDHRVSHGIQDIPPGSIMWQSRTQAETGGSTCPGAGCQFDWGISAAVTDSASSRNGHYAGVWSFGINDGTGTHHSECGEWLRQELWLECHDGTACFDVTEGTQITVKMHMKETVVSGSNIGTVYDDDDFGTRFRDGNEGAWSLQFLHDEGAGFGWIGGVTDIAVGQSDQSNSPPPFQVLFWLDGFAFAASDEEGAWIGAHADE